MSEKQNLASLWLAKKLKEGGWEGECEYAYYYFRTEHGNRMADPQPWRIMDVNPSFRYDLKRIKAPALLHDLCVKYMVEMFGDPCKWKSNYTLVILTYLQEGQKDKAERHFWNNCLLNPKNKV